jgi:hypothetical protein
MIFEQDNTKNINQLSSDVIQKHNNEMSLDSKLKLYETIVNLEVIKLTITYINYNKNPKTHKLYTKEWASFWTLKASELQSQGIDYKTYDYKPEWIKYFSEILIKKLYAEDIEDKKYHISKNLELTIDDVQNIKFPFDNAKSFFDLIIQYEYVLNKFPIADDIENYQPKEQIYITSPETSNNLNENTEENIIDEVANVDDAEIKITAKIFTNMLIENGLEHVRTEIIEEIIDSCINANNQNKSDINKISEPINKFKTLIHNSYNLKDKKYLTTRLNKIKINIFNFFSKKMTKILTYLTKMIVNIKKYF